MYKRELQSLTLNHYNVPCDAPLCGSVKTSRQKQTKDAVSCGTKNKRVGWVLRTNLVLLPQKENKAKNIPFRRKGRDGKFTGGSDKI
jgi:hypothetical protein